MGLSLRVRLLISYLILLAVALGVIAAALFLFLGARPAPTQPTYRRLESVLQGINLRDYLSENTFLPSSDEVTAILSEIASAWEVRVLNINLRNGIVLFDSANIFPPNNPPLLTVVSRQPLTGRVFRVEGNFSDPDQSQWLFSGVLTQRFNEPNNILLLADPHPTQSLQQTLAAFGSALAMPILQAGLVGVLVAVILAFVISRNIARPLQAVADATTAVAQGEYDQRVPVSGPPEVTSVAEAFNRMSAEVRATQLAEHDFIANVSHDLKTPLTSIQGYSQAIMDGTAKDPKQAAAVIHDEAGRLNRMVIELTDLERLQAGRLSMRTSAVDMSQIAQAIGQRLHVVAEKKDIELQIDAPSMPEIAGDGDRLAQVMMNLISNAIKYTPARGHVWVSTRINGGGVEVVVRDDGIGIPRNDLPRIFERFYQVDKTRGPRRGTGLGLAITHEIVQAHGGRINAHSDGPGQGTMFTVWLPSPEVA
jgi:signal transduction histidine kinase